MAYKFDPEIEVALKPMMEMMATSPRPAVHDIQARRDTFGPFVKLLNSRPPAADVSRKDYHATTPDGYALQLSWFSTPRVDSSKTNTPAVFHIHGGGMIMGSVDNFHNTLCNYASQTGVPFLSVDYRLAPEHPHPTPAEDAYTGLSWLHDHVKELNVDPSRIAVMGESAGGGIAAGVALMARDRKLSPPLAKQILIYPMLDDRWTALLGKSIGTNDVSPYAAPARAEDVSGLPPSFIYVGGLDILRDEDMEYARRIAAAKIPIEFHLYPSVPHGFEGFAPKALVTQRALQDLYRALQDF